MAETIDDTQVVVEIPVDSETNPSSSPIQHHPLTEISHSPGHLLLLNLYQRAESQLSHRIALKETRIDSLKREAFYLSSLFFAFHALSFTLTFTSTSTSTSTSSITHIEEVCKKWWVPCLASLVTSLVLISSVQVRVCGYWRVMRELQRERSDGRGMKRFVQELRMKGSSFDLSKEMVQQQVGKKKKSSSVEIEWVPIRWLKQNLVTICLLGFAGLIVPASKFTLCI